MLGLLKPAEKHNLINRHLRLVKFELLNPKKDEY